MFVMGMPLVPDWDEAEKAAAGCRGLGLKFVELPLETARAWGAEALREAADVFEICWTLRAASCDLPEAAKLCREIGAELLRLELPEDAGGAGLRALRAMAVTVAEGTDLHLCVEAPAAWPLLSESPRFGRVWDGADPDAAPEAGDLFRLHDLRQGQNGVAGMDAALEAAMHSGCRVLIEADSARALSSAVMSVALWLNRRSAPDELWDVYDDAGRPTGRTHRRGEPLGEGERHLCVHVWMRRSDGRYLLTRRAPNKSMGGLWESTGGCAVAGEDSITAAVREAEEETGLRLDPANGEFLFRYGGEHFLCDVWLFRQDVNPSEVVLQPGETDGVMLADAEEIRALEARDAFVKFEYLDRVLDHP